MTAQSMIASIPANASERIESPRAVDMSSDGRSDIEERLIVALDSLPLETREILVLNAYRGYRFDEIATMLDKSPEAVWARASRARAQLRRLVLADDVGHNAGRGVSKSGTGEES